jgi:hypothetical protein
MLLHSPVIAVTYVTRCNHCAVLLRCVDSDMSQLAT